jgi:hypothetical protein
MRSNPELPGTDMVIGNHYKVAGSLDKVAGSLVGNEAQRFSLFALWVRWPVNCSYLIAFLKSTAKAIHKTFEGNAWS